MSFEDRLERRLVPTDEEPLKELTSTKYRPQQLRTGIP
jgi:hypothetical protein